MNDVKIDLDIRPNAKQQEFFLAREKLILYGGSKGGGKSWALRWKQILRRLTYNQSKGLLLRRTYPELWRTHIVKIKEELKPGTYSYHDQSHTFRFPNGSTLECGSCQYEADVLDYQGSEYDDIAIDEATQFTEYQFDILKSCLRTVRPDLKTQLYLGANPGGVGHGWVKREFIQNQLPDHHFVPAKVWDNPVLMKADPDYVKTLEGLPDELRRMYLEGDWDVFAGQVFWEWRRDKHIVTEFDYPLELCAKLVCFDWGYNNPGCASWLAFTPDGRVYQYRELYQTTKSPQEWAREIKIFLSIEKTQEVVLPHDCFSHQGGNQMISDVFENEWKDLGEMRPMIVRGNTGTKGAVKSRLAIMHQYLTDAPDGKPWFQIHAKCTNIARTLPELVYSQTDPEEIDSSGEDHCIAEHTLILTQNGWINIENLIGAKTTCYNADVIELWVGNHKLVCTPNHKILTPYGWKEAQKLKQGSQILWLSVKRTNGIEKRITGYVVAIYNPIENAYTAGFGKTITAEYQKPSVFTTSTTLEPTIDCQTLKFYPKEYTSPIILPILQRNNERLGERTPSGLAEKAISECQKSNEVKRLSKVIKKRKANVYDISVNHPLHAFVANGFIVHNCYDSTSLGLLRKVELSLGSGAVKGSGPTTVQRTWTADSEGNIRSPDFWKAMKENLNRISGRDWTHK